MALGMFVIVAFLMLGAEALIGTRGLLSGAGVTSTWPAPPTAARP